MYYLVALRTFTMCNHHLNPFPELSYPNRDSIPDPLTSTILLPVSMTWTILVAHILFPQLGKLRLRQEQEPEVTEPLNSRADSLPVNRASGPGLAPPTSEALPCRRGRWGARPCMGSRASKPTAIWGPVLAPGDPPLPNYELQGCRKAASC